MKGHILVNLSGKDSKLKTWFDQQKDSNISRIVLSAVIYYELYEHWKAFNCRCQPA